MSKKDEGKVVTVDGVKGRLLTLVVRGPDRRKASGFEDGEAVTVTLAGIYRKGGDAQLVALVIDGQRLGLQESGPAWVPVVANGKAMLSIDPAQIARKVERRSGVDRRKAPR